MADITLVFGQGMDVKTTGAMKAGVPVTFSWRTPTAWPQTRVGPSDHATLQVVSPSDSNTGFTVSVGKTVKKGSGASSVVFQFGQRAGQIPYAVDTLYAGTVVADYDCAGFTLKLN